MNENSFRVREIDVREIDQGSAYALSDARVTFIRRTYAHLAGAVLAFIALSALLVKVVPGEVIAWLDGPAGLLGSMVFLMVSSMIAQWWARSRASVAFQYMGLGLYIGAFAIFILPLIYWAANFANDKNIIPTAGILTLGVFGGLTLSVFVTRKDYRSLYPILAVGSMVALAFIVAAIAFGFSLGLLFCFAMVALISGFILYQTSEVLHRFPTDFHVAAALMLFSSIATLFLYIFQILAANRD
jgi:FtsH-binding integral membrane protein